MVERYLFLRLRPEERHRRDAIVATLRTELGNGVRIGTPADAHAEKAWDVSIAVGCTNPAAAEAWEQLAAPVLAPLRQAAVVEKGWTMEVSP